MLSIIWNLLIFLYTETYMYYIDIKVQSEVVCTYMI